MAIASPETKWRVMFRATVLNDWQPWSPAEPKRVDGFAAWFETEQAAERASEFMRVISHAEWKIEKEN